jgi:hypothetical protein
MKSLNLEIGNILEYLQQIRKLEDYLIFDIEFPNTWKILKKFVIEDKFLNQGSSEDETKIIFSFVSEMTSESLKKTHDNIIGIINYNLEREMKENLLQSKIDELKNIFNNQSLDQLKNLSFDLKQSKKNILIPNGTSENVEILGQVQEE